jgi:hypothetical protein
LLIGNIQLSWHGTDKSKRLTQPLDMKWSIEEEARGERLVLADLPTAGPFVVKLPAGSYRVKSIHFDNRWETWVTVFPTKLQVQSGGCTSLGTWALRRETELQEDWITGKVFKGLELPPDGLQQVLATRNCLMLATQPESFVRSKLAFQRFGGFEF